MSFDFHLPYLAEGMTEVEVVNWKVQIGDSVAIDQPLVEVMSDEVTVEIPSPRAGTIAALNYKEGEVCAVGAVLFVIDEGASVAGSSGAGMSSAPFSIESKSGSSGDDVSGGEGESAGVGLFSLTAKDAAGAAGGSTENSLFSLEQKKTAGADPTGGGRPSELPVGNSAGHFVLEEKEVAPAESLQHFQDVDDSYSDIEAAEEEFFASDLEEPAKGRKLAVFIGLLLLLAFLVPQAMSYIEAQKEEEAQRLTDRVNEALFRYKTDVVQNKAGLPAFASGDAAQAVELAPSPSRVGLLALVTVWEHKWHFRSTKWDPYLFEQDDALTRRAVEGAGTGVAWLARAWLLSNGCLLMPAGSANHLDVCTSAGKAYEKAYALLEDDPRRWLTFELVWTWVRFVNQHADAWEKAGSLAGTALDQARQQALSICNRGKSLSDSSPVNDVELAYQCTVASARAGEWGEYLDWARLHLEFGAGPKGLSRRSVLASFSAANPVCTSMRLKNRPKVANPYPAPHHPRKSEHRFCSAVGYLALGCYNLSVRSWSRSSQGENTDWSGLREAFLGDARRADGTYACVYTDHVENPGRLVNSRSFRKAVGASGSRAN
jgi:hypothetical protein